MWRAAILVGVVVAVGCGDDSRALYHEKPRQSEAVTVVRGVYGMADAPAIEWIEGDRLDCAGGFGFNVDVDGVDVCSGGWFFEAENTIRAAWLPDLQFKPLAHEFGHAFLYETTGSGDGGAAHAANAGPIWGNKVSEATITLTSAGLTGP